MSALSPWRELLRPLIPRGFLRRDQGDSLFVSDYPRHGDEAPVTRAIQAAGFSVCISQGIARIDALEKTYLSLLEKLPEPGKITLTEENFPLYLLAKRLLRAAVPLAFQPLDPLRFTLKCLDGGDFSLLSSQLPPMLALLQRRRQPLPGAAGKLILLALEEQQKGDRPC